MNSKSFGRIFKKTKPFLVVAILAATVLAFIYYFKKHPEYITRLFEVHPSVIVALIAVNFVLICIVAVINHVSAQMCNVELDKRESLLLTIYSSLANFFGPLQSGPGVRAGYLKAKHKVRIRDYTFITLIGYAFFAIISALFLVIGVLPWWISLLALMAVGAVCYGVLRLYSSRSKSAGKNLFITPRKLGVLGLATFLQVSFVAVRYAIELAAIGAKVSFGQVISYAGGANFALFVSLTPDGIGIRETFLLFTQKLHGVSTHDIVSASLLDRGSYVIFLALLAIVAAAMHAKKRFSVSKKTTYEPKTEADD